MAKFIKVNDTVLNINEISSAHIDNAWGGRSLNINMKNGDKFSVPHSAHLLNGIDVYKIQKEILESKE